MAGRQVTAYVGASPSETFAHFGTSRTATPDGHVIEGTWLRSA
ncbi:hypothetical protein [Streptomyces sp. NTH33]|nr:hypothetical protein [Streptomyces sp. NTH33]